MGRGNKKELYNYLWKKPEPIVPRHLRLEIDERTSSEGTIIKEVQDGDVLKAIEIFQRENVEAIAVCLLHSYQNPKNEIKVAHIISEVWPNVAVSLSHLVAREIREFERMSTTVLNAYISRPIINYVSYLLNDLQSKSFNGHLFLLGPSGLVGIEAVKERPIYSLGSGPIAGAIGACFWGNVCGYSDIVTIDVGGTTIDVSLIKNGRNIKRREFEIEGYPLIIPNIDIRSIGAGGGSIARVDCAGLLSVGPESAGADPGPICYGQGGTEPTVTDAAIISGLIDSENFLGGEISLDVGRAKEGLERIGSKIGLNAFEISDAILQLAKTNMANAVREILIGQGYDPRNFTLMSFGGAGGLFATGIAKEVGIKKVIIPPNPSVFSAWGLLTTDLVHTYSWTYYRELEKSSESDLVTIFTQMEADAINLLESQGVSIEHITLLRTLDLFYAGQHRLIEIPWPENVNESKIANIQQSFELSHKSLYGYQLTNTPIIIATLRLTAIGHLSSKPVSPSLENGDTIPLTESYKGERRVFYYGRWVPFSIYYRNRLKAGNVIYGPAIIEESSHTTIILEGQTAQIDGYGNIVIKLED